MTSAKTWCPPWGSTAPRARLETSQKVGLMSRSPMVMPLLRVSRLLVDIFPDFSKMGSFHKSAPFWKLRTFTWTLPNLTKFRDIRKINHFLRLLGFALSSRALLGLSTNRGGVIEISLPLTENRQVNLDREHRVPVAHDRESVCVSTILGARWDVSPNAHTTRGRHLVAVSEASFPNSKPEWWRWSWRSEGHSGAALLAPLS